MWLANHSMISSTRRIRRMRQTSRKGLSVSWGILRRPPVALRCSRSLLRRDFPSSSPYLLLPAFLSFNLSLSHLASRLCSLSQLPLGSPLSSRYQSHRASPSFNQFPFHLGFQLRKLSRWPMAQTLRKAVRRMRQLSRIAMAPSQANCAAWSGF